MAFLPPVPVDAPAPRGPRYGLLAAANGPLDLEPHMVGGGVVYEPVGCGFARLYPLECGDDTPTVKQFDPADDNVVGEPFVAYATYVCGTAGHQGADMEAKVRQRLVNGEQTIAEAGLAAILETVAVTVHPGDPTSFRQVVGELEQWLYGIDGAAYGNRGYLHSPIRYATLAAFAGVLIPDGPLWRTQLGTIWSFGGGYPDDGRLWITGNTTVWRDPEIAIPPAEQVLDRTHNQYDMLAERTYAVAYDCVAATATYTGDAAAS